MKIYDAVTYGFITMGLVLCASGLFEAFVGHITIRQNIGLIVLIVMMVSTICSLTSGKESPE